MKQIESIGVARVKDLGFIDYSAAYAIQQETVKSVIEGGPHTLLFSEHPPVFTLGRLATEANFLLSKGEITKNKIDIVRIDRGGEVTFHGPGQLVIYPILRLTDFGRDLKAYLKKLEIFGIELLRHFGVTSGPMPEQRGVWAGRDKIISIGIGVRKWVSFHGLAVNVNTDLKYFSMIKPCGLDVRMTSLSRLKGEKIDLTLVKEETVKCFARVFDLSFL